jgi:hypothetical protein
LYARFGAQHPAAGCAIDLDNLEWACRFGRSEEREPIRVLVSGRGHALASMLSGLRNLHIAAARAPSDSVVEYARAWRYSHILEVSSESALLTVVAQGSVMSLDADASNIARHLRAASS